MKDTLKSLFWIAVALLGGWAFTVLGTAHDAPINSVYILIAALCSYTIGYRFYSKWIAARVLMVDDRRATPCEVHDDGRDFVKTNKWIVFGHHFAAISGPGPLVGPVLAAQFGYLPGTLWILIGVVLGGAVQDFVILFSSLRRSGKSLGQMIKEELSTTAGFIAMVAILSIMIILLAVLSLVVVNALAESPWGVFTVGATIPIALGMGGYLRFVRVGKVLEASAMGVALLLLAVWGGKYVHMHDNLAHALTFTPLQLAWGIIIYGLAASVLPIWMLLAPRDYLSTFMKLGTIALLACGIFLVLPELKMPALSRFIDGSGPVVPGKIFPFCFITIACGAISGFHTLIASGTTPKILTRESYARPIGYGAMCLESLVAIMAIIAACTLDPGVYLSMNMKGAPEATIQKVNAWDFPVTAEQMNQLASESGEKSLFGRTGGAATLAVGMSQIFSKLVHGHGLGLWYHFAIMFEALFILTTLDAGTRVGRYMLQDLLGGVWKPLGDTSNLRANIIASVLIVAGWGWFLLQGVNDEFGGIKSLWPLFGIANQMLATIALCLATTIVLKMQRLQAFKFPDPKSNKTGRPIFTLVVLLPLTWLFFVTMTAGSEKIFMHDSRIGFLAAADTLDEKLPDLQAALTKAERVKDTAMITAAKKAVSDNRRMYFNDKLDAVVAGFFMVLVLTIVILSASEWIRLIVWPQAIQLKETPPVALPEYTMNGAKPINYWGVATLGLALAKELSGEAHLQRAEEREAKACHCQCVDATNPANINAHATPAQPKSREELYVEVTERRFNGPTRCC